MLSRIFVTARGDHNTMTVKININHTSTPPGKLADAELHFTEGEPLAGLKMIGFQIWERRTGGGRNVTFPARTYSVNGERRSFALLRPIYETAEAQGLLRERILEAFAEVEEKAGTEQAGVRGSADGGTRT